MSAEHFHIARALAIPHGEAVALARAFCPSGGKRGDDNTHGSLSPCDDCTSKAVLALADLRNRGKLTFTPIERALARTGAAERASS